MVIVSYEDIVGFWVSLIKQGLLPMWSLPKFKVDWPMGLAYACSVDIKFIAIISSYSIRSLYLLSSLKRGQNIKVLLTRVDDTLKN